MGMLNKINCLIILVALIGGGCRPWRIIPPNQVESPTSVYLTRYASHTRLALPPESGHMGVEYGFGDWHWYAREETGAMSGVRAALLPMDAAYSRREVLWSDSAETLAIRLAGNHTERIEVESARVATLRQELEAKWDSLDAAEEVVIPRRDTVYRRTDENYHLANNSNQQTATWLEQLGCRIEGTPLKGEFRVEHEPKNR